MEFSLTIYGLLYLMAISVCLPMGLIFLFKFKRSNSQLLGTFYLLFCAFLLQSTLAVEGYFENRPELLFLPIFLTFLVPLLFGAGLSLQGNFSGKLKRLFFFPIVVEVLLLTVFYFLPNSTKSEIYENSPLMVLVRGTQIMVNGLYLFYGFQCFMTQKKAESRELFLMGSFLKKLFWIATLYCLFLSFDLLSFATEQGSFLTVLEFIKVFIVLGIAYYSLSGLFFQSLEFEGGQPSEDLIKLELIPDFGEEYETLQHKKFRAMNEYVKAMKLYQNPNLTLGLLAVELNMNQRKLSELIKECTGMNFNRFINAHRVTQAMEYLEDSEKDILSVVGIGAEAGFKSKASFFSKFKDHTGLSPAEFRGLRKSKGADKFAQGQ